MAYLRSALYERAPINAFALSAAARNDSAAGAGHQPCREIFRWGGFRALHKTTTPATYNGTCRITRAFATYAVISDMRTSRTARHMPTCSVRSTLATEPVNLGLSMAMIGAFTSASRRTSRACRSYRPWTIGLRKRACDSEVCTGARAMRGFTMARLALEIDELVHRRLGNRSDGEGKDDAAFCSGQ